MKSTITFVLMFFILRLSAQPDGSVAQILSESEFVKCPYSYPESYHIFPDKNGNIVAVGLLFVKEENGFNWRAIRFNNEGKRIAESAPEGLLAFYKVLVQEDNKIIFLTSTYENNVPYGKVMRLNEDLSVDNTFTSATELREIMPVLYGAGALALDKQNRIYVGATKRMGPEPENERFIYRLLPNGSLDEDFQDALPEHVSNFFTYGITVQDDGKILVSGVTTSNSSSIIRLNEDGSLDESFHVPLAEGNAFSMLIDDQKRILVGGTFHYCNDEPAYKIVRLLPDGTTDASFITGSGFGDYRDYKVRNLWLHENGKIGVSGEVYQYKGAYVRQFAILNDDGTIWQTYQWSNTFDNLSSVYSMCKVDDDKLALFGLFGDTYKVGVIGGPVVAGTTEQVAGNNQISNAWLNNSILELYSQESETYEIYSITGQLCAKGILKDHKESLSVAAWPNSLYTVYFHSPQGYTSIKVIKN
ncbi:MAG: hypothetical protein NVV82_26650 [Sporocytophaga sp.]|nr:hypothetical protein [Sporocytophaga sp.]